MAQLPPIAAGFTPRAGGRSARFRAPCRAKWYQENLYFHDFCFELVVVYLRFILHTCLISVDGVDAIVQEFGNAFGVVDAQTDERKDAHFGGQRVGFLVGRRVIEELIVARDEMREEV